MEAPLLLVSEPSTAAPTPSTLASVRSTPLAPVLAWHRSVSLVPKKKLKKLSPSAPKKRGSSAKEPVRPCACYGSTTEVRPTSPAKDPLPTPGNGRGSQLVMGPAVPKAVLAAKEQGQLTSQVLRQVTKTAPLVALKGKATGVLQHRLAEHPRSPDRRRKFSSL